jgi:peptidoglycan/xylan/chitin deacetylase (PgdA/CDA1 family)
MPVTLLLHDVYRRDPAESGFRGAIADRYKLPLTAFEVLLARLAAAMPSPAVAAGDPAARKDEAVLITFDDGGLAYHAYIADRLEALGWRGHCFMPTAMIGRTGFLDRRQLRDLHARGHGIGSHSVTHPTRFSACSWRQMVEEWSVSRRALEDILGAPVVTASVPGGYYATPVAEAASACGIELLFTSEPRRRVRRVGACDVLGRYTIRDGCPPGRPPALVNGRPGALGREWAVWNAKKVVKSVLGGWYPRVGEWIARGAGPLWLPSRKEKSS